MCVSCGYAIDAASGVINSKAIPKEGDISICLNCGHIYVQTNSKWTTAPDNFIDQLPSDVRQIIEKAKRVRDQVVTTDLAKQDPRA